MSNKIGVLSLLEAYEERQQEAQAIWKKSQWNITKAKQRKGADAVTASNVREELRSRCVLLEDIPHLLDDEGTPEDFSRTPHFRLVDPVEQEQTDKENSDATTKASSAVADPTMNGLRNRKIRESDAKTKWIVSEDSVIVDEEIKLRSVDSVELFGFPVRELRQAKQEAHRAVALYVEAANLMLAVQQEMKKLSE